MGSVRKSAGEDESNTEGKRTMALTPVRNLQLHNQIERVLHVQGNYRGGILEMAIVVDRTREYYPHEFKVPQRE